MSPHCSASQACLGGRCRDIKNPGRRTLALGHDCMGLSLQRRIVRSVKQGKRVTACRDASQVSQTVAAASGRIFSKITEAALKESAAGAFEDEAEGEAAEVGTSGDGSSKDQVLARSALLARAAAADAMLLTARLIQERLSSLQQCLTSGAS